MDDRIADELLRVEAEWSRAMVTNDTEAIGRYMADDWMIVGSNGSISDKGTFLALVQSGALTHDVMDFDETRVRVYGNAAVVTARGVSSGQYRGQAFRELERVSDVFVRQGEAWQCVLTHLSHIS
jgi:ketosteroid isomerase-like protein